MNANDLRLAMAQLPHPPEGAQPPHWDYWRLDLWTRAQYDDPQRFMSWPCIYHTMLVQHWSMQDEFDYLMTDLPRWIEMISPHPTGWPTDWFKDTAFSSNMINQAYHLKLWEDTTGKRIEDQQAILEIGGGYGAMALLCWRLGFRGTYFIYDLPEFQLLQSWFLSQEQVGFTIVWLKEPMMPVKADLLMGLYSLSEMPMADRDRLLEQAEAQSYLFLYSPKWEAYDNLTYFSQLSNRIKQKWYSQMTPRKVDWYLVGW